MMAVSAALAQTRSHCVIEALRLTIQHTQARKEAKARTLAKPLGVATATACSILPVQFDKASAIADSGLVSRRVCGSSHMRARSEM